MDMTRFPMEISTTDTGGMINIVGKVKVFDNEHSLHLLQGLDGQCFTYTGFLNDGFESYSIMKGRLERQFPVAVISPSRETVVLGHRKPSWDSLRSTIDACSGFGGLAQGAMAAGFNVQTAVDQNQKMLDLHSKACTAQTICGDVGDDDVIIALWRSSEGASTLTAGFSCQPFSQLGDGKSHADDRSACLTKVLKAAYYLQSHLIILECVAPAAHDGFVKQELDHFIKHTGYHCSQSDLKLDCMWPCRRHRSWWILSSPVVGPVELMNWLPLPHVTEVQHVIPEIRLWDERDEAALALDEVETHAFGVPEDKHGKYLLNAKGTAPCALHAWGSQTRPCPCGCRKWRFSNARLESKGLHGCIVRSATHPDGSTTIRHLHPNEAMSLNTFDPVVDFGVDVRLTLSAVGQIACPLQALHVLGSVMAKIDGLNNLPTFAADAQVQAYRSWLLMRCRQVWSTEVEPIHDAKLLSMIQFWHEVKDLSLQELMFPMRWDGKIVGTVTIASILDHLIRAKDLVVPTIPDETALSDDETPWFDQPILVDDPSLDGCLCADSCTVVFEDTMDPPLRFQPKCGPTLSQFMDAQQKLIGQMTVTGAFCHGKMVTLEHVMEVGQVIVVRTGNSQVPESHPQAEPIAPTAPWTQPIEDPDLVRSPPRKISKYDVGECTVPTAVMPDDQSWLDASPLLGLQGEQFLKLHMPAIQNAQQLWSLRHQFLRAPDRIKILDCQERFWADDEIRFHLHALIQSCQVYQAKHGFGVKQVTLIDPLVITAWIQNRGFDCKLWAKDHPEIRSNGACIATVVLLNHHWVPVFMSPVQDVLHVHTWDGMGVSHEPLADIVNALAQALGFASALIRQEHRLFFTSDLCGALAIAFLRYALVGAQLPSDCTEAAVVHARLKDAYVEELQRCQIARRPWVWGAGDSSASSSSVSHNSDLQLAVNITRDQRIDMINSHGTAMGDDEIRFHVMELTGKQPGRHLPPQERQFLPMEPLIFNCWDSIGKVIAKQWSDKNPQVLARGQHVVSAVAVDGHWLPIWMVPAGNTLQIHTFQSEVDFAPIETILSTISNQLGFQDVVIHRIPEGLPEHEMCGALAMTFLAHIIMEMPMPETLLDLRYAHTNMRASFVAHLYGIEYTPKPVIWGTGTPRESGQLPRMPEAEETQTDESQSRARRTQMLISHSYAMGDDEIQFHLGHLVDCFCQGPRPVGPHRRFVPIPVRELVAWTQGDVNALDDWKRQVWTQASPDTHLVMVLLLEQNWVPVWFCTKG